MYKESSVSDLGDNLVQVEGELGKEITDDDSDEVVVSIHPLFDSSELSSEGMAIAVNSMIQEESVMGCPVCKNLRPYKIFNEMMSGFIICQMCLGSCPECGTESLESVDAGIECSNCEFTLHHQ